MIKWVLLSLLFSYAAVAGLPPTSTQGSAGGGYKTTFQFNFPYIPITQSGTNASFGQIPLSTGVSGTLPVANGGTGQTSYTNGQLLIGNTTGNTLDKSTLTGGRGVSITNGAGSITIDALAVANQGLTTCTTSKTIDWSTSDSFTLTLTNGDNCAITFSNARSGQVITVDYFQPSSTGSATVSYSTTVLWSGGVAPTMTTGANATDSCTYKYNGTDYRGSCIPNFQ